MRRAARAVCANVSEAFGKRRYAAHLLSKLSDADAENLETEMWLKIAVDNRYISPHNAEPILQVNAEIGKLLHYMQHNISKFILKNP